jgi:predicted 3-demethylubiquinone-9 3-methyltransferase (glyoxalase superfamily)
MPTITPFLWFDNQAEEAANFYISIFPGSRILHVARYTEEGAKAANRAAGSVMLVRFEIDGQEMMALNGGPVFQFSPAISLMVNCQTQQEVDHLWDRLSEDGEPNNCGWVKDKFGVSWQIVPTALGELMQDPDPAKSRRVMQAMLQMKKIDGDKLREAYNAAT